MHCNLGNSRYVHAHNKHKINGGGAEGKAQRAAQRSEREKAEQEFHAYSFLFQVALA